jgi:hypothetical protein
LIAVGKVAPVNGENPAIRGPTLVDHAHGLPVVRFQEEAPKDQLATGPAALALATTNLLHVANILSALWRVRQAEAPDLASNELADGGNLSFHHGLFQSLRENGFVRAMAVSHLRLRLLYSRS